MAAVTLTADVGYGDGEIPVSGAASRPVPFMVQLEDEELLVTAAGDTVWSVIRGSNGTARSAHPSGARLIQEGDVL